MLLDKNLNITQKCACAAQKVKHILGSIKKGMISRPCEVILPLYSVKIPPGALCPAPGSPTQRHRPIRRSPEEGHKVDHRAGAPLL